MLTGGLVLTAVGQGYFLLRSDTTARITAEAAKKSADAGMLSADALIATEGARLLVLLKTRNLFDAATKFAFWYRTTDPTSGFSTRVAATFEFKNYGKTPATLNEASVSLVCSEAGRLMKAGFWL